MLGSERHGNWESGDTLAGEPTLSWGLVLYVMERLATVWGLRWLQYCVLGPTTVLVVDWTAVLGFSALRLWVYGMLFLGCGHLGGGLSTHGAVAQQKLTFGAFSMAS